MCLATPSASEAIRSATAPGSASAGFWLRVSSIVAASVHGPQTCTLNGPVQSAAASCIASRSADSRSAARR